MFDSTHKENIKKTRETIIPIVDTVETVFVKIFHRDVTGAAQKFI